MESNPTKEDRPTKMVRVIDMDIEDLAPILRDEVILDVTAIVSKEEVKGIGFRLDDKAITFTSDSHIAIKIQG